jgi:hypothetical protein
VEAGFGSLILRGEAAEVLELTEQHDVRMRCSWNSLVILPLPFAVAPGWKTSFDSFVSLFHIDVGIIDAHHRARQRRCPGKVTRWTALALPTMIHQLRHLLAARMLLQKMAKAEVAPLMRSVCQAQRRQLERLWHNANRTMIPKPTER